MTPAAAIGMLDRQLVRHGSTIKLLRGNDAAVAVLGLPRGYKPDEIGSGINQGDSLVVLSPSGMLGTAFEVVPPKPSDRIEFGGRLRAVQSVEQVLLANVVVRFNVQVRG